MSKASLFERRPLDAAAYEGELLPVIQRWCERTPFTPIRDWRAETALQSAEELPAYLIRLTGTREARSKAQVHAPYRGEDLPRTYIGLEEVDVWHYTVELAHAGSATRHYDISGTHHCRRCHGCSGRGRVRCDRCSGGGQVQCGTCSGSGQVNETQRTQELRRCTICSGRGYHGYGDSRRVCERCVGKGMRLEDVSHTVRVQCSSCAGRGRVVCGRCSGSGELTCGTCEGAGQLLWWVRMTSEESPVAAEAVYAGRSGYDASQRARTLAGNLATTAGVTADSSATPARENAPLDSFGNLNPEPGYDGVFADYPDYATLVNPRNFPGEKTVRDWALHQIAGFKTETEADESIRLARLGYSIVRTPISVVHYAHAGHPYVLWVNPGLDLVEDHDGPVAQAAADALIKSTELEKKGELEAAFGWACRAIVTDDARPHELAQRRRISRRLTTQYAAGGLLGLLLVLGAATPITEFLRAPWSLVGALVVFAILLLCTRYVWLVRAAGTVGERLLVTTGLGALLTAAALFQPQYAGYAAIGVVLLSLLSAPRNRRYGFPESLRKGVTGADRVLAEKMETLVLALQPTPSLRRLRVTVQVVSLAATLGLLGAAWHGHRLAEQLVARENWTEDDWRAHELASRLNPHLVALRLSAVDRELLRADDPRSPEELLARLSGPDLALWGQRRTLAAPAALARLLERQAQFARAEGAEAPADLTPLQDSLARVIDRSFLAAFTADSTSPRAPYLALLPRAGEPIRVSLLATLSRDATRLAHARMHFGEIAALADHREVFSAAAVLAREQTVVLPTVEAAGESEASSTATPQAVIARLQAALAEADAAGSLRALGDLRTAGPAAEPAFAALAVFGDWLAEAEAQAALTVLAAGGQPDIGALEAYYQGEGGFASTPLGARYALQASDEAERRKLQESDAALRALLDTPRPELAKVTAQARELVSLLETVPAEHTRATTLAGQLRPTLEEALVQYAITWVWRNAGAIADGDSGASELLSLLEAAGVTPARREAIPEFRRALVREKVHSSQPRTVAELDAVIARAAALAQGTLAKPDAAFAQEMITRTLAKRRAQLEETEKLRAQQEAEAARLAREAEAARQREQQAAQARLQEISRDAEKISQSLGAAAQRYAEFARLLDSGQWRQAAAFVERKSLSLSDEVARPITAALQVAAADILPDLYVDPAMTGAFPRHPVLDRYKFALCSMLYLDAVSAVEAKRLRATPEAAALALLGGLESAGYRRYTESVALLQRLTTHDERLMSVEAAVFTGWFTYARLDWLAQRAADYGFARLAKANGAKSFTDALASLRDALNGRRQTEEANLQSASPRERLGAYRDDFSHWLDSQRGFWIGNDLVLVCGAADRRALDNGDTELGLFRLGGFELTAVGRLSSAAAGALDETGGTLLLIVPRNENGTWPIEVGLTDDGELRVQLQRCRFLPL